MAIRSMHVEYFIQYYPFEIKLPPEVKQEQGRRK